MTCYVCVVFVHVGDDVCHRSGIVYVGHGGLRTCMFAQLQMSLTRLMTYGTVGSKHLPADSRTALARAACVPPAAAAAARPCVAACRSACAFAKGDTLTCDKSNQCVCVCVSACVCDSVS